MFPRSRRIHRTSDILRVFRQGARLRMGNLTIFHLPGSARPAKVTVIVDTKVSKRAVVRNLVKRRLRDILEKRDLPAGLLIARVYPGLEKLEYSDLQKTVDSALKRSH